ncbi:MAG TPA: ClpX C4-type zinc finger protein [Kofleriaceae bacterium]|nr:ClpX C4-type zinc finger protein [Kofleriaceae bacterium]
MLCPICAQALDDGELVMVCGNCHKALGGAGGLALGATGEFRVPSPELLAAAGATVAPGERPRATAACSWCGKLEGQVRKLLGRGGTALCNECVSLACDIMEAELGSGWK